jgi:hypothetical protein
MLNPLIFKQASSSSSIQPRESQTSATPKAANISEAVPKPPTVDTSPWSPILLQYLDPYALIVILQALSGSLLKLLSDADSKNFLKIKQAKARLNFASSNVADRIPSTIDTCLSKLGLKTDVILSVCCPSCFALSQFPVKEKPEKPEKSSAQNTQLPITTSSATFSKPSAVDSPSASIATSQAKKSSAFNTELQPEPSVSQLICTPDNVAPSGSTSSQRNVVPLATSSSTSISQCSAQIYLPGKQYLKSPVIPICSTDLFKPGNGLDEKPYKVYAHQSLKSWLGRMLWRSNFEDLIDSPLAQPPWSPENYMHDVWDGSVWNTFEDPSHAGSIYTRVSGNLVFSLFVDWFNPYHSKKSMSL